MNSTRVPSIVRLCHLLLAAASTLLFLHSSAFAQALRSNGLPMNPDSAPQQRGNPGQMVGQNGSQYASQNETSGNSADPSIAWERQDMGVRASRELHSGAMHGPTPNTIPGGQVITTVGLVALMQQSQVAVFDALGGAQTLPNAIAAAWAAQPGAFDDPTQQQLAQMLRQVTRGNPSVPLVFYCGGLQCWMSYNASLRAIQLGYRNVLWYRGGLDAWQRAGQQLVAARGQGPQPMQQEGNDGRYQNGGYPQRQPQLQSQGAW